MRESLCGMLSHAARRRGVMRACAGSVWGAFYYGTLIRLKVTGRLISVIVGDFPCPCTLISSGRAEVPCSICYRHCGRSATPIFSGSIWRDTSFTYQRLPAM